MSVLLGFCYGLRFRFFSRTVSRHFVRCVVLYGAVGAGLVGTAATRPKFGAPKYFKAFISLI